MVLNTDWNKKPYILSLSVVVFFWVSVGVWDFHADMKGAMSMPSHEASPYFLSSCGRQNSRNFTRFLPIVYMFCVTPSCICEQDSDHDGMSLTKLSHHLVDWVCQRMLIKWVWLHQLSPQRIFSLSEIRDMKCNRK
jgi:hypothetical protein